MDKNAHSGLSVIVITRNEEHDLEDCLNSIKAIAHEIVVVDSGSTDRTMEIARRFTNKVFSHEWNGYSAQKQFALDQSTQEWVLNIDADERVSIELAEEIAKIINASRQTSHDAYAIPFEHYFMGRLLRFGGVQGETHIRLFRKGNASYGSESIHEGIQIKGSMGRLKGSIKHMSYRDIREYLEKCNEYTSRIAEKKWKEGKRFHWWHHLRLPFEFVSRYFVRLGILDGGPGLTYALLSSYYAWLKFLKLKDFEGNE